MMDLWDKLGATLSDIIGSHDNNHVGWAGENIIGYAEGGEVSDPLSTSGILQSIGTAAKPVVDKGYGHGALGVFTNSPTYIMQHYAQLGKFFTGTGNSNPYNTSFKQPQERDSPTPEAADPNEFYAKWYAQMRKFAEAEEVASRGKPNIRSF